MSIATPSTDSSRETQKFLAKGMAMVVAIALAKLVLHCIFNNRYGYFRDEFDYLSCGDHLAGVTSINHRCCLFWFALVESFWEIRCAASGFFHLLLLPWPSSWRH